MLKHFQVFELLFAVTCCLSRTSDRMRAPLVDLSISFLLHVVILLYLISMKLEKFKCTGNV